MSAAAESCSAEMSSNGTAGIDVSSAVMEEGGSFRDGGSQLRGANQASVIDDIPPDAQTRDPSSSFGSRPRGSSLLGGGDEQTLASDARSSGSSASPSSSGSGPDKNRVGSTVLVIGAGPRLSVPPVEESSGSSSSRQEDAPGPTDSASARPSDAMESIFSVDTSRIPSVPQGLQAAELQGLEGVSVFNQAEFERGVLEQVDQAMSVRQQAADRQRAEKELDRVLTDIRCCKKELAHVDRQVSLASAKSNLSPMTFAQKEIQRTLVSMRTKRENKAKQLKTLRARQRSLLAKLSGSDVGLHASDDEEDEEDSNVQTYQSLLGNSPDPEGIPTSPKVETEWERLIRLGEMTPFGSTVQSLAAPAPGPRPVPVPALTDFEKFMAQKTADDMTRRKRKPAPKKKPRPKPPEAPAKPTPAPRERGPGGGGRTSEAARERQRERQREKPKPKRESGKLRPTETPTDRRPPGKPAAGESSDEEPYFAYKPVREESSSLPRAGGKRRRKTQRDLRPNWGSDAELSDRGDASDDEEYTPGFDDFAQRSDDDDHESPQKAKSSRRVGRKARVSTEDFEDGTIANLDDLKRAYGAISKRSSSSRKAKSKDDATQDLYQKRLKEQRRSELRQKQLRIERGEEEEEDREDMQFDGGLTIPSKTWSKLYRYQRVGVKWLWELHQQQAGGIVGDEMGLGKTIQMIAFLEGLRTSNLRNPGSRFIGLGPVLIVCPATVMHQWVKEFHKWMPAMRVAILHDSGSHTGSKKVLIRDIALSHGTLITSYSGVRIQESHLLKHDWHYLVLDEGHKIRNPDAAVTNSCKQFRTCHRLILSGSPMQNNLRELWSLIDFVFPGKLGTLPVFMEKFSVPITIGGYSNATRVQVQTAYRCATILRDTINPYLLRRLKADVKQCLDLPDKNEQVLFCRLSEEQTQLYKEYLDSKECQMILNRQYQVFAGLITLRKICNHPDLASGGPKIILGDQSEAAVAASLDPASQYGYWLRSGKMIVVDSLLKLWHKQGHRVLLFSQSKQMLDILEVFVKHTYSYMRMDGSTSISSRQPLIQQYNTDTSIFLFLLTTRVGGLGVNLTGANRVVIFDPDWNPSTDTQARERAWRIGQRRAVTIYRLITNGTIEEKIYHRQIFKQFLTNRVLKDPRQRRFFKSNDLFELFTLGAGTSTHGTETSAIFAGVGSDVRVTTSRPPSAAGGPRAVGSPSAKPDADEARIRNGREEPGARATETGKKEGRRSRPNGLSTTSGRQTVEGYSGTEQGASDKCAGPSRHLATPSSSAQSTKNNLHKTQKKKRKKDARLEGHRIAHLAKHSVFKPRPAEGAKPEPSDAQQDDYVLNKLLKKSGVHSALQHDNIMAAGNPDYLLVEGEADRVARDAVQALKQSRRHCRRATSGIPTPTGSRPQGASTPPPAKKPRFGQKSNSKVTGLYGGAKVSPSKDKLKKPASPATKPEHFSGTELLETAASKVGTKADTLPTSQSLLSRMRQRNVTLRGATDADGGAPSPSQAPPPVDGPQSDLLSDIRDFVAFQAGQDGRATTAELLAKFKARLPPNDSALFKSMLREICSYQRVNGSGVWSLKEDFK